MRVRQVTGASVKVWIAEIATGKRSLWKELRLTRPIDSPGDLHLHVTPDGRLCVQTTPFCNPSYTWCRDSSSARPEHYDDVRPHLCGAAELPLDHGTTPPPP